MNKKSIKNLNIKSFFSFVALTLMIIFHNACGEQFSANSDSNPNAQPDREDVSLDLAFCDNILNVSFGKLCAIQPSKTASNILDSDSSPLGYGYHVIGIPHDFSKVKGIWIHLSGSYGRPFNSQSGSYATQTWLNELLEQNFLVIQIAYNNKRSVYIDICKTGTANEDIDNCAELVGKEIIEGTDYSTIIEMNFSDGIYNRINKLIEYVNVRGVETPSYFQANSVDWSKLHMSGHSQGAEHTYYIAKNVGIKTGCLIGGPYNSPDSVNPGPLAIADWYTAPGNLTYLDNLGAFVVDTDLGYPVFVYTYEEAIGFVKDISWFEAIEDIQKPFTNHAGDPIVNNGHGASIAAVELKSYRAQACLAGAANY